MSASCFSGTMEHSFSSDEQDLFSRLSIRGFGKQVWVYIEIDKDRMEGNAMPAERAEGNAKPELEEHEEEEAELVQGNAAWHKATLLSLEPPGARVQVTLEYKVANQEGVSQVKTKTKIFIVNPDKLRAAEREAPAAPLLSIPLHPALQEAGESMENYDMTPHEAQFLSAALQLVLQDSVRASRQFAARVQVHRQSKKGELPVSLTCRALEPFKVGKLMLVPGDAVISWIVNNRDDEAAPGKSASQKKACIHHSMQARVRGDIQEVVKDGRRVENRPERTFDLLSPLVSTPPKTGDEVETKKLLPFWAVIRGLSHKSCYNMKMSVEDFTVPQMAFKGCNPVSRNTVVSLPVMRNVAPIDKGDLLTLPYSRDADDSD